MLYNNIPEEMRNRVQWCVWKYEETDTGKPTKVPYNPVTNKLMSVTDRTTWCSFNEAIAAVNWYSGIGYVFSEDDPYCGIDLDAPKDHLSAEEKELIMQRQRKIFATFNSYSELSPSGNGLHIIIRGRVPHGRKRDAIEVYSKERYFTMTGNVHLNVPIADKQDIVDVLWQEMGKGTEKVNGFTGDLFDKAPDNEIYDQACKAENGDKFQSLFVGNWQQYYPSQSEADLALINILAFYTQSRMQIVRLFEASALGKREKARRSDYISWMINKSFDRMLPPLDIDDLTNQINAAFAAYNAAAQAPSAISGSAVGANSGQTEGVFAASADSLSHSPNIIDGFELDVWRTPPDGFIGHMVDFMYRRSPRPVYEISLVGALGLMSGICGRAYNISGTGLNHYIMALAVTGVGKEAMAQGVEALMNAVALKAPIASEFIGPSGIASGQAVIRHLSTVAVPSMVSVVGEIGLRLKTMASDTASAADVMLKSALLDLYNKSGHGNVLRKSIYAKTIDNTENVKSPAYSLIGESVPERFYEVLDDGMIADGLLPRFIIVEYHGKRVPFNEQAELVKPTMDLIDKTEGLVLFVHDVMNNNAVITVQQSHEAREFFRKIEVYTTDKINTADQDTLRQLWNRVHLKTMKLSALLAVSNNTGAPTISIHDAKWACSLIMTDTFALIDKFNNGTVGNKDDNSEQFKAMKKWIVEYCAPGRDYSKYRNYKMVKPLMFEHKLIPYSFLVIRAQASGPYRNDKRGYAAALKAMVEQFISSGYMVRMSPSDKKEAGLKPEGEVYAPIGVDSLL